jgi:hypothetical protein
MANDSYEPPLANVQVTLTHKDLLNRCVATDTAYRAHLVNCLCLKTLRLAKEKRRQPAEVADKIPATMSEWNLYRPVQDTFLKSRHLRVFLEQNTDIRLITVPARDIDEMNDLQSANGMVIKVDTALKTEFTTAEITVAKPICCDAHERWRKSILGIK